MADNSNLLFYCNSKENVNNLCKQFVILNRDMLTFGLSVSDLEKICFMKGKKKMGNNQIIDLQCSCLILAGTLVVAAFISILLKIQLFETILKSTLSTRCVIPNNYFIWEATRPETNCDMCKDVKNVLVLHNVSRTEFSKFAYSPQPMIVKGAALHWPAMHSFNFHFFKNIYENIVGSYESVDEECQILTFKTEFKSLEDVFTMSESRVQQADGEKPWYVGWSNCHPEVLTKMRRYYTTPHFLPEDSEHARMDYIFIGYQQGAVMHIDYISRLMWQAQIQGHKTWRLMPPPDCDHVCSTLSFRVDPGDIVLLDTRQWYHDTCIDAGEMSLTVSSEYG